MSNLRKIYIVKKTTLLLAVVFLIKEIRRTMHYKLFHERNFPFGEVEEIIHTNKNRRKKGNKLEIKNKNYYILIKIKNGIVYVINAKRK
jgi:hypothetical protein